MHYTLGMADYPDLIALDKAFDKLRLCITAAEAMAYVRDAAAHGEGVQEVLNRCLVAVDEEVLRDPRIHVVIGEIERAFALDSASMPKEPRSFVAMRRKALMLHNEMLAWLRSLEGIEDYEAFLSDPMTQEAISYEAEMARVVPGFIDYQGSRKSEAKSLSKNIDMIRYCFNELVDYLDEKYDIVFDDEDDARPEAERAFIIEAAIGSPPEASATRRFSFPGNHDLIDLHLVLSHSMLWDPDVEFVFDFEGRVFDSLKESKSEEVPEVGITSPLDELGLSEGDSAIYRYCGKDAREMRLKVSKVMGREGILPSPRCMACEGEWPPREGASPTPAEINERIAGL